MRIMPTHVRLWIINLVALTLLLSGSWEVGSKLALADETAPIRDAALITSLEWDADTTLSEDSWLPEDVLAVSAGAASSTDEVRTLIIFNRHRMQALYGAPATTDLLAHLDALALDLRVEGRVIMIESHPAVATALAAWEARPTDNGIANAVTDAVHGVITDWQHAHPEVEYLVLVGDDRAIPFRRVNDRTSYPESNYLGVSPSTSVGAALAADMFLTDDFYADREFSSWEGQDVYIPDLAVGRLVETPAEISGQIAYFLEHEQPRLIKRRLVTGYDFIQDSAAQVCSLLSNDMGNTFLDCTLIGDTWSSALLQERLTTGRYDLISLNTHASHTAYGAPTGSPVTSRDVMSGTADMAGAVLYHVGTHAGLNVSEVDIHPLDWPQTFASKRAIYIASSGFSWGSQVGIRFAEVLVVQLTQELIRDERQQVGRALIKAKQSYYEQTASEFNEIHEKTLMEFVLYGLPMYEIETGASAGTGTRIYLPLTLRGR